MISQITLDFKISNCQYRCMHCDGAKDDYCLDIPLQRIKEIAFSFLRHRGSLFENLFVFISDSAFLYKEYAELVAFLDKHSIRYKKEPINGVIYDRAFFESMFPKIAKSSLDTVRITLFGLEHTHNKFARYKNSFDELMKFAKAFSEYKKHIIFHLYVTPESIKEIGTLQKYISSEFPNSLLTYEYSNCYKGNYRRRHHFLLSKSHREMAHHLNLPLVSEDELVDAYQGKKPIIWHNNLWIRAFGNGDCQVAIFPLGAFYPVGTMDSSDPKTIITKCIEHVQNIQNKLPSYNCLIDEFFEPDDPYLYDPSDAINLWWARYTQKYELS